LEERMKSSLGTKVSINQKNAQKGKIEIEYYSIDDLERLTEILTR
ncbi:MAG: chromosome partitioning protein ParB, partial [Lachnospiraceae bacterium]|nr:chromosome partitioning protein ParB [Lachnospiraceae bacterium]